MNQSNNFTKSLRNLSLNGKTKPKSPDLTGTAKIHRRLIVWLWKEVNASRGDVAECNLAAWQYQNKRGPFLSVEISESYVRNERCEDINIFDQIARQQDAEEWDE
jgi:hypothetical protein